MQPEDGDNPLPTDWFAAMEALWMCLHAGAITPNHARLAVEPVVEADPQRVSYLLLGKLEKIIISGKRNANIDASLHPDDRGSLVWNKLNREKSRSGPRVVGGDPEYPSPLPQLLVLLSRLCKKARATPSFVVT
jgi:hypothetical protein